MGGGEARGEGEGGKSWAEGEKRGRGREPFSVCSSHLGEETRKKGVKETEKEKSFGYFVEADSILTAVV